MADNRSKNNFMVAYKVSLPSTRDGENLENVQLEADSSTPQGEVKPAVETENKSADKKCDFIVTGETLLKMKITNLPCLVAPIIPKYGVVALAGSSDTGKSILLRQLAISIVAKESSFLGFQLNATHHSAIIVSTEDDQTAMGCLMNTHLPDNTDPAAFKKLRFVFDTGDILSKLETALKMQKADCIVVDTFTDLYGGELNQANKVRSYLNEFSNLARRWNCVIIFLHHTGKRTDNLPPSKDNLIGSQGFEAKMRLVIELKKDLKDPELRHMCIVKGNYLPSSVKEESYVLKLDKNLQYVNQNRRVPFADLVKPSTETALPEWKTKALELRKKGLSVRDIERELANSGTPKGRTAINNWLKDCPSHQQPLENLDTGQLNSQELDVPPEDGDEVVESMGAAEEALLGKVVELPDEYKVRNSSAINGKMNVNS